MGINDIIDDLDDLLVDIDDIDEQTKRELLRGGVLDVKDVANPKCRWCKGTGKLKLLTSIADCDCVR